MPFLRIFLATEITGKNEDNKIFFYFLRTFLEGISIYHSCECKNPHQG